MSDEVRRLKSNNRRLAEQARKLIGEVKQLGEDLAAKNSESYQLQSCQLDLETELGKLKTALAAVKTDSQKDKEIEVLKSNLKTTAYEAAQLRKECNELRADASDFYDREDVWCTEVAKAREHAECMAKEVRTAQLMAVGLAAALRTLDINQGFEEMRQTAQELSAASMEEPDSKDGMSAQDVFQKLGLWPIPQELYKDLQRASARATHPDTGGSDAAFATANKILEGLCPTA
jgi:hypothetical protein